MLQLRHPELHGLYNIMLMVSMKRTHRFWPLIGFPVDDVARLHDYARDFVISYFEIEHTLNMPREPEDDGDIFLRRMYTELTQLIGQREADEVIAWVQGWPFEHEHDVKTYLLWNSILLPLHRRKPEAASLADELQPSTLSIIDRVMDINYTETEPLFAELEQIAAEHIDNWEYMIHYIYNRREVRDGTKVEFKMSPLSWLSGFVDTKFVCSSVRELRDNLTPEDMAVFSRWLDRQPFWEERKEIDHGFAELLDYVISRGPS